MIDLVDAFVLSIVMLVLLCFLSCYRFSANKDLIYITQDAFANYTSEQLNGYCKW